jgi:hypothetical protein
MRILRSVASSTSDRPRDTVVIAIRPRPRRSIEGLFWARPLERQHDRIRELARALTPAQIADLVRLSEAKVRQIIKARL